MQRTPFPPSHLEERPLCTALCWKSLHLSDHFQYARRREWEREKNRRLEAHLCGTFRYASVEAEGWHRVQIGNSFVRPIMTHGYKLSGAVSNVQSDYLRLAREERD